MWCVLGGECPGGGSPGAGIVGLACAGRGVSGRPPRARRLTLSGLTDTAGISGSKVTNIVGNGHNVYYDSAANSGLGGKTYALVNGGQLIPK